MDIAALKNNDFRAPGFIEKLREALLGVSRPLACAQIEITSICAGQCAYCPREVQKSAWKARHMAPATFAELWPVLRKTERAHLQGWGEPLLHPHFFDYQELAAKAGCLTSTTSSGQVMNEEIAGRLVHSGMDIIAFSLAGIDQQSNEIRKNVPFDKVSKSIGMVRKAVKESKSQLEIHLAYLLLADRMELVGKLPELMERMEIDLTVVSTLDYLPAPSFRAQALYAWQEDKLNRAEELLEKAANEAEKNGRFIVYSLPGEYVAKGGCRENVARNIYIDADGNLSPCVYLNVPGSDPAERRRIFGNCLEQNPFEIWRSQEFQEFRNRCLSANPDPLCENCPKRKIREIEAQN